MKIFGKCLWHNFKHSSTYHDCSDMCMWSSKHVYYKECVDCGYMEKRDTWSKWKEVRDPEKKFLKEIK